jgi:ATP-dependent helicase HrpB
MLQRIRTTLRPELRLMVMSATLDPAPIVGFLGDARGLTSEGRSFPVTIRYAGDDSQTPLALRIVATLRDALAATSGDILVFLPGVGEIKTTRRAIESAGVQGWSSNFMVTSPQATKTPCWPLRDDAKSSCRPTSPRHR